MSCPLALHSSTLWERGSRGVPGLLLAGGCGSDSLLASELSESDPEMLEISPAGKMRWDSGAGQRLTNSLPKSLALRMCPQP